MKNKKTKNYAVSMDKATPGVQKNFRKGLNAAMVGTVVKKVGRVSGLVGLAELGFGSNKKRGIARIIGGTAAQIGGHYLAKYGEKKAIKAARQASYQKKTRIPLKKRKK